MSEAVSSHPFPHASSSSFDVANDNADRMSHSPDEAWLYVPSFEKDNWNSLDPAPGRTVAAVETKSGAHGTFVRLDGARMFLGGLKSSRPESIAAERLDASPSLS